MNQLKKIQSDWAAARGIPAPGGYVTELAQNLFQPLNPATIEDFNGGAGGELTRHGRNRPPKLHALHSSAALVCNVFDYWRGVDGGLAILGKALGLPAPIATMKFEATFPTGLPGQPPALDVALFLTSGEVWAIEAKFTEPFGQPRQPPYFKPAYFSTEASIWGLRGLRCCDKLVIDIARGKRSFRHLDAPQLLKHALGLSHHLNKAFTLVYLYVDADGDQAAKHRKEIDIFVDEVGTDLKMVAMNYDILVRRLREHSGQDHAAYFSYLADRYRLGVPGGDGSGG